MKEIKRGSEHDRREVGEEEHEARSERRVEVGEESPRDEGRGDELQERVPLTGGEAAFEIHRRQQRENHQRLGEALHYGAIVRRDPRRGCWASRYILRGIRPARYARRAARTASFIASAIATGAALGRFLSASWMSASDWRPSAWK